MVLGLASAEEAFLAHVEVETLQTAVSEKKGNNSYREFYVAMKVAEGSW